MPRRPLAVAVIAATVLVAACSNDADRATEAGLARIDAVNALLEQHKGDGDAALKALEAYEVEHRQQIAEGRRLGVAAFEKLSSDEKAEHAEKWSPKIMEKRARTETLLRTFEDPRPLMRVLSRILI